MPMMQPSSQLVGHVEAAWQRNKRAREIIDRRLLNCLRRRKGVYAESDLREFQEQGMASVIFMPLSATKCRAAASWIRDIVLPAGDRAWSLERSEEHTSELQSLMRSAYAVFCMNTK